MLIGSIFLISIERQRYSSRCSPFPRFNLNEINPVDPSLSLILLFINEMLKSDRSSYRYKKRIDLVFTTKSIRNITALIINNLKFAYQVIFLY